jgi:hypothetical protein
VAREARRQLGEVHCDQALAELDHTGAALG